MGIPGGLSKKKLPLVLLNPLFVSGDTWEDCHQEPMSFPVSEVPTSQAQLQKSTHVTDCLQWQLDQHFDCGDSKAILGLSSTKWGFTTNPDSGNQGPLFLGKKEKRIRKLWSICWSSHSCGWRRQRTSPNALLAQLKLVTLYQSEVIKSLGLRTSSASGPGSANSCLFN